MAVAFSPKGVVFGPTRGVVLNRILRPVIGGVSQALITGIPAYHDAALAASPCHRSRSTSASQSVCSLCEQRGKDGPGDAWQRIEDRGVTLLVFLPRCGFPVLLGNRLREHFAEPVELPPGVGELTVDEPYPPDQAADAGRRGLDCARRNCQSALAQLAQYMGRTEAADAVVLEYPGDG